MDTELSQPVTLFYSYAHRDLSLRNELEKHLSILQRQEIITQWHEHKITAGADWAQAIDSQLMAASIILLLISPDFIASEYCHGIQMQRALERHAAGQACVIPIILRPVDWQSAPFAKLQVLPSNKKPICVWRNRDEAFLDVARGIRTALEDLKPSSASKHHLALPLWNVPYPRNPFFTGREELLTQLHDQLTPQRAVGLPHVQAISGLGGLAKHTWQLNTPIATATSIRPSCG